CPSSPKWCGCLACPCAVWRSWGMGRPAATTWTCSRRQAARSKCARRRWWPWASCPGTCATWTDCGGPARLRFTSPSSFPTGGRCRRPPPGCAAVRERAERGRLRLYTLFAARRPVASVYGVVHGGKLLYYQSGYDPAWASKSVGLVLLARTVQEAYAEGLHEFDFLRGNEAYKA